MYSSAGSPVSKYCTSKPRRRRCSPRKWRNGRGSSAMAAKRRRGRRAGGGEDGAASVTGCMPLAVRGLSTIWYPQRGQATRTAEVSGSVTAARNVEPHFLQVRSIVLKAEIRRQKAERGDEHFCLLLFAFCFLCQQLVQIEEDRQRIACAKHSPDGLVELGAVDDGVRLDLVRARFDDAENVVDDEADQLIFVVEDDAAGVGVGVARG